MYSPSKGTLLIWEDDQEDLSVEFPISQRFSRNIMMLKESPFIHDQLHYSIGKVVTSISIVKPHVNPNVSPSYKELYPPERGMILHFGDGEGLVIGKSIAECGSTTLAVFPIGFFPFFEEIDIFSSLV